MCLEPPLLKTGYKKRKHKKRRLSELTSARGETTENTGEFMHKECRQYRGARVESLVCLTTLVWQQPTHQLAIYS